MSEWGWSRGVFGISWLMLNEVEMNLQLIMIGARASIYLAY